ncbi:MAG: hypothetical protein HOO00_08725 [Rhodospirillaceae bacterium]|jgi:hypothetical protein|nr:hypothetical protein [Rhodospirillaceae bacterium]MBT5373437.1 hypothetical protein [Rhodospirillaceae bacterium]MBT5659509.1 hypothetical protein [Rhodospirillaceae bacterium]MBT5751332.1 hypothetical protein [Rhodospirillaceae bacterium]
MSDVTEIYICKAGQSLKDGRVEYSDQITDKGAAESDAKQRCKRDGSIAKIAYYSVNANGDFKVFFSYTNPQATGATGPDGNGDKTAKKKRKKAKPKPSLITRFFSLFRAKKKKA